MAKLTGLSGNMKWIVAAGVGLVVWAILGVGIGLVTLFNNSALTANGTSTGAQVIPSTVLSIAQTLVSVAAGIGVALKYFE